MKETKYQKVSWLLYLLIGTLLFIAGRVVIVDGLIHDILIIGGAVIFIIGIVMGVKSLFKKKQ